MNGDSKGGLTLNHLVTWIPTVLALIAFSIGYGTLKNRVDENRVDVEQIYRNLTILSNDLVLLQVAKAENSMEIKSINAMLIRMESQQTDLLHEIRSSMRVRSPDPYEGGSPK